MATLYNAEHVHIRRGFPITTVPIFGTDIRTGLETESMSGTVNKPCISSKPSPLHVAHLPERTLAALSSPEPCKTVSDPALFCIEEPSSHSSGPQSSPVLSSQTNSYLSTSPSLSKIIHKIALKTNIFKLFTDNNPLVWQQLITVRLRGIFILYCKWLGEHN